MYVCMYVYVETLNAHAPTTFTNDVIWFILFNIWNNQQPPRSQDDNGVMQVIELLSPLPLWSTHVWIA
jgi:hypothetical protein